MIVYSTIKAVFRRYDHPKKCVFDAGYVFVSTAYPYHLKRPEIVRFQAFFFVFEDVLFPRIPREY